MKHFIGLASAAIASAFISTGGYAAVKPGDLVTPDNAAAVADLVSPGNLVLVKQGMRMKIVSTGHLEWPPPYKSATEKYAAQVRLNDKGELDNYVAGLPFPLLDPNDPQAAAKVMWNFSFRPQYTDDVDIRDVEIESFFTERRQRSGAIRHRSCGLLLQYRPHGSPAHPDRPRSGRPRDSLSLRIIPVSGAGGDFRIRFCALSQQRSERGRQCLGLQSGRAPCQTAIRKRLIRRCAAGFEVERTRRHLRK